MGNNPFAPPADMDLSWLNTKDWVALAVFADYARYFLPKNEEDLRVFAKMDKKAPIPEDIEKTLKSYQELNAAVIKWLDVIYPNSQELARDIVRHRDDLKRASARMIDIITTAIPNSRNYQAAARALTKELQSPNPSAAAKAALPDLSRLLDNFMRDMPAREKRATALLADMNGFSDIVKKVRAALDLQKTWYENNFGAESQTINILTGEIEQLNQEIQALRKKESDEILVLKTAPAYLVIIPFGWLILMGVLAGVGADLDQVRRKLSAKIPIWIEKGKALSTAASFLSYHKWGADSTATTVKQATAGIEVMGKIEKAWGNIKSGLTDLNTRLLANFRKDVDAKSIDFAESDLEGAMVEWDKVVVEAKRYLQFQIEPATPHNVAAADVLKTLKEKVGVT